MQQDNVAVHPDPPLTARLPFSHEQSFKQCNQEMFESQMACDVTLRSISLDGAEVRTPAHRYILISRNPVFRAMLCGPLALDGDVISITDVASETLVELLRYLYYEEARITDEIVLELMYSADKYLMPTLTLRCVAYLSKVIDVDNVCTILEYAILYGEKQLTRKCLRFVQRNTGAVLSSEGFLAANQHTLGILLNLEVLTVSEDELLDWLITWIEDKQENAEKEDADAQTVNTNTVDALMDHVRLASLSSGKLEQLVSSGKRATDLISRSLSRLANSVNDRDSLQLQPRLGMPTGRFTCSIIQSSTPNLIYNGRPCNSLVVDTSEQILIHKIYVLDRNNTNAIRISIAITQNNMTLSKFETGCNFCCRKSLDCGPVYALNFNTPIKVEEGMFEVTTHFKFSHGSYGSICVGVQKSSVAKFGGLELCFPEIKATPIASIEFSVA